MQCIEGVFSGTLSYIFNSFGADSSFSEVVTQAKAAGYTEPDPREDLSGIYALRSTLSLENYAYYIWEARSAVMHLCEAESRDS